MGKDGTNRTDLTLTGNRLRLRPATARNFATGGIFWAGRLAKGKASPCET